MGNKRHKPEEIVSKLRQVELVGGQSMAMSDAIRQTGVSMNSGTSLDWT
ncbi:MAG: hypothetical protein AAF709_08275 [Pseudomonadota bacterium]